MVRQFHDDMQARVQNDGEFSGPFEVTNGVKQGCVLHQHCSAWCFLSAMLMDAFQDSDTGFPIRHRFDGNLLNFQLSYLYICLHAVIFPLTVMLVIIMYTCTVLICVCRQNSLWLMLSCCKFESRF